MKVILSVPDESYSMIVLYTLNVDIYFFIVLIKVCCVLQITFVFELMSCDILVIC